MRNKNHFMSLTTKLFTLHKTYSTNTKILGLENNYITSKTNVTQLKQILRKESQNEISSLNGRGLRN